MTKVKKETRIFSAFRLPAATKTRLKLLAKEENTSEANMLIKAVGLYRTPILAIDCEREFEAAPTLADPIP